MLNHPQRAFILGAKHKKKAALERQLRELNAELFPLERDYAVAVGMPTLRGEALLRAIETEVELAKQRERRVA